MNKVLDAAISGIKKSTKVRIILTILGISVGAFVYLIGNVIISSIEYNMKKYVDEFDHTEILYNDISEKSFKYLHSFNDTKIIVPFFRDEARKVTVYDGIEYYQTYDIVASTNLFYQTGIPFKEGMSISKVDFLYGRPWTNEEANNHEQVIVISKYTSQFHFGKIDSVGEYISIDSFGSFLVIGVIEDSLELQTQKVEIIYPNSENNSFYLPEFDVIIPLITYNYLNGDLINLTIPYVVQKHPKASQVSHAILNDQGIAHSDLKNHFTKEIMLENIDNELENYNIVFNIILVVTIILSGLIVMLTLFFSIKERLFEIGIRVVSGASNMLIIGQFIVETILLALISVLLSYITILFVSNILNIFVLHDFKLVMSHNALLYLLGISITQSVVFGLAPAIYTIKINPIDILKFS